MNASSRNWPELLTGLGLIAIGLVIGYEAATLKVAPMYSKVGPGAFMWLAMLLLVTCGGIVTYKALVTAPEGAAETSGPGYMLLGLAATIFLLEPLGFIATATLLFVLTARGLGSKQVLRDLVIAIAVCTAAYLLFAKGLGLRLPIGTLFT